jgi:predicted peptidase
MKHIITTLLLLITLAAQAQNIYVKFGSEPSPYGYVYHKPVGATKLMVFLPGSGTMGNGTTELYKVEREGIAKLIKDGKWPRTEFVTVTPQLKIGSSSYHHATLHDFVLRQCKKHGIDTTEVYMFGISRGANSIYQYIIQPYSVKAAIVIAGAGDARYAYRAIKTKLWAVHGTKDEIIPFNSAKAFIDNYNAVATRKAIIYPMFWATHSPYVWETAAKQNEIYNWMLTE